MKNLIWAFALLLAVSACTHPEAGLDAWEAGSANDDVFLHITDGDLADMKNNGLNYLEVDWLFPSEATPAEIEEWAKAIKERCDQAGITVWTVHIPYGGAYDISQVNDSARREAVRLSAQDMAASARLLAPKRFVIHPSAEPIADEEREARITASRRSLVELAAEAAGYGIPLLVENLPRTCLGRNSGELLRIIDGIDNTGICFDVNHLLGESHASFVANTRGRIGTTHMSDYDGTDEKHWLPGEGVIDWTALLNGLQETGYNGPFIYEVVKRDQPIGIATLGNRWKKLKEEAGKK